MTYDKQYFTDKFNAIPAEQIGVGILTNKCALYHCGVRGFEDNRYILTDEAKALIQLFGGKSENDSDAVCRC